MGDGTIEGQRWASKRGVHAGSRPARFTRRCTGSRPRSSIPDGARSASSVPARRSKARRAIESVPCAQIAHAAIDSGSDSIARISDRFADPADSNSTGLPRRRRSGDADNYADRELDAAQQAGREGEVRSARIGRAGSCLGAGSAPTRIRCEITPIRAWPSSAVPSSAAERRAAPRLRPACRFGSAAHPKPSFRPAARRAPFR